MTRVAVVGCGRVAREVHLPVLAGRSDVRIVALADPNADARQAAARFAADARAYDGWEACLRDVEADAVVIASPPATHAPAAVAALERGLHTYVEKPMALDGDGARTVVNAWQASGRAAMVGLNYRFNPLYDEAGQLVRAEAVGPLVAVRTVFSRPPGHWADWQASTGEGGGALIDLGSHHLDLVRHLSGRDVEEVHAVARQAGRADEAVLLTAKLTGGALAGILVCQVSAADDRLEFFGERGRIVVDRYRSLRPVVAGLAPAGRLRGVVQRVRSLNRLGHLVRKWRAPRHEPSHALALGAFLAAVGGTPCGPDPTDGSAVVRAVAAARVSLATGRAVPLGDDHERSA
jgi:predicted dehydrogenase